MATPKFAWGIDIGNRALKAIKLVRDGDALRVDDFDVIEHETVLSNAGDNREQLVLNALRQFVEKHPTKGGAVSVGVSGKSSFARFIKLPPVEEKKIPEIVRFEAIQQIPFPLDDVEWSYQLFRSAESPDVEVGIFAMRKELINQHIKYFTDQDLNVVNVQMNPLAVYNAMYYDQRIDGTTMIIDLGAENTDLIIADAETVWLRSIPIGGNNFTETLVKSFKLNFAKAEDLKRNAATSKYARQIFQAMRPVFADLVAEVQRSIGFYASVHRDSRINRIVAVGGTFKLPGLQKYLQQNLQLEVERLDTLGAGAPPDPKQAATYQDNVLSLVSAYGLALQAMGEGKITSSLLPARIRRERLWQEKQKFFAAAAALFVVGTGIGYASVFLHRMAYDSSDATAARGDLQRIESDAKRLDGEWSRIQGSGSADRQRIVNVRGLTDYRALYVNILSDLRNNLPVMRGAPDEIKKTPRGERHQIFIDNVVNRYLPDLGVATDLKAFGTVPQGNSPTMPGGGAFGAFGATPGAGMPPDLTGGGLPGLGMEMATGAAPAAPAAGAGLRGYVISIFGTTPNKNVTYVTETFRTMAAKLAKDKIPPHKQFYIDRVEIIHLQPIERSTTRLQQIKTSYEAALRAKQTGEQINVPNIGGGGFMPGGFGRPPEMEGGDMYGVMPGAAMPGMAGPTGPMTPDKDPAYKDRTYKDETILQDQEFIAVLTIVLDPAPAQGGENAAPAAPASPAANAQ
jgi:type IV pilus assembly protein PilM